MKIKFLVECSQCAMYAHNCTITRRCIVCVMNIGGMRQILRDCKGELSNTLGGGDGGRGPGHLLAYFVASVRNQSVIFIIYF